MLNGMTLPECEACTWFTIGCLCRRCMARYELERRDRGLDDEWGRPVPCSWERSEWLMPFGENFEEAAQWYERECEVVWGESGVVEANRRRKRRLDLEGSVELLSPEEKAHFEAVGWEYCRMLPAVWRSARTYCLEEWDADTRMKHRDVELRGDKSVMFTWECVRRKKKNYAA